MAIMIPAECDLARRPMSEQIVFEAIKKNLSNEWYVFHSFDYVTRDLNRKRWDGEIDFLLYHPERGFLVIEVKGGRISYRNGQWFQEGRVIDPVEQAKRNKYAVMNLLRDTLGRQIPAKFAHAVCFPSCGAEGVWPAEARDIVITGSGLRNIEEFAIKMLDDTACPSYLAGTLTTQDVMSVLSPFFEYGKRLSDRIGIEEKQFFRFTEQQCTLLDSLDLFKRMQICGCAGSGKTVMAVKKAERLAEQGETVLLLCFNQLLASHLRKAVEAFPQVTAAAFFEFCIKTLKIPEERIGRHRTNPKLYHEVLPDLIKIYAERAGLCYDAIIVDEGQDFAPEAWDAIASLTHSEGYFYIFYDPDQNIFNKELKLPDFGQPPVLLTKNCRNTKKIFEVLKPYLSTHAAIMDESPMGSDVRILQGDCRKNLADELERLVMAEQIPPTDIVIIGGHSLEHTSIGENPNVGRFHIVPQAARVGQLEISYYTYMKFKGCEAKVVILLDVDDSDPRWADRNGIYTAMSRAIHQLVILKK